MAFSKQARVEVVYSSDDLRSVRANAVMGEFEPEAALGLLLRDTGYTSRRNGGGKFVVTSAVAATGSVRGTLIGPNGRPAEGVAVRIKEAAQSVLTDRNGDYFLIEVPSGAHTIVATAEGYQPLHITEVRVRGGREVTIGRQLLRRLSSADDTTKMAPFVVVADSVTEMDPFEINERRVKPFTTPNVDFPRTINDVQAYYIFDAKAIDRSGAADVEDFLHKHLTMESSGGSGRQGIFIGGQNSSIALRGLPTLVLINGRRATSASYVGDTLGQPDVTGIPISAIERIEVLPTSASAIYGASAVGGVVNVVLKRNFKGGEMRVSYQNTFESDAPIRKVDVTTGFSLWGGRTQVMLSAGVSDMKGLLYQDRPFLRDYELRAYENSGGATGPVLLLSSTPNIRVSSGVLTLKPAYGGGSLGSNTTFIPLGTTPATAPLALGAGLLANAGKQNLTPADTSQLRAQRGEIGTPFATSSFHGTLRHEVTPNFELYGEFAYTATRSGRNTDITYIQSVPATAPTNPFNQTVTLALPIPGNNPTESNNTARRMTVGMIVRLPWEWTAQADYTWSGASTYLYPSTAFSTADITTALNAGTINPFLDSTLHPVDYTPYKGVRYYDGPSALDEVSLRLAGPVWRWRAGAITSAVGLQRRQQGLGDFLTTTEYPNFPARNTAVSYFGKKQVTRSVYAEFLVPLIGEGNRTRLVRGLELQAAARIEDFKVSTGTSSITLLPAPAIPPVISRNAANYQSTQPTAGVKLDLIGGLSLRASYSGAFSPPGYTVLARNPVPTTNLSNITDPRRGGEFYGVQRLTGGNPDLKPETTKSWNAGVVFEPAQIRGLRLSVDWFEIVKRDNISTLRPQQAVDLEGTYPGRVIRAAPVAGDAFSVGRITMLDLSFLNLLRSWHEGFDFNLSYRRATRRLGTFEFSALGTYTLHSSFLTALGQPVVENVNNNGYPLKFRHTSNLAWEYRNWRLGWTTYYHNRYVFSTNPASVPLNGGPTVPRQIYHDFMATYRFGERSEASSKLMAGLNRMFSDMELQVGIDNVFNKPPARSANEFSGRGDVRLREYRLMVKKPF